LFNHWPSIACLFLHLWGIWTCIYLFCTTNTLYILKYVMCNACKIWDRNAYRVAMYALFRGNTLRSYKLEQKCMLIYSLTSKIAHFFNIILNTFSLSYISDSANHSWSGMNLQLTRTNFRPLSHCFSNFLNVQCFVWNWCEVSYNQKNVFNYTCAVMYVCSAWQSCHLIWLCCFI